MSGKVAPHPACSAVLASIRQTKAQRRQTFAANVLQELTHRMKEHHVCRRVFRAWRGRFRAAGELDTCLHVQGAMT